MQRSMSAEPWRGACPDTQTNFCRTKEQDCSISWVRVLPGQHSLGDVHASSHGCAGQLPGQRESRDDYLALLHCSAVMMAIYQAIPWWTGLDLDTRVSVLPNSSTHVVPSSAFLEGRRTWRELPDTLPSMHNNLRLGKKKNNKKKKRNRKNSLLPMIPW